MAKVRALNKEMIYLKLNDILDCIETGQVSGGRSQLENLIHEVKMGIDEE